MERLRQTWETLMNIVATDIILKKFTESNYDESWDEGKATYYEYEIPARVRFNLAERDFTELGENLKLDAVIIIRKQDLDALNIEIAPQDRFLINTQTYRITKIKPVMVAGALLGYEIGVQAT
jgi:hypothetical protein